MKYSGIEALERRALLTVAFQFDYSLDSAGFFAAPARRAALEAAAQSVTAQLTDTLAAITPAAHNSWTLSAYHPQTGEVFEVQDLSVPADRIIVYVGARDLPDAELASAGPNGWATGGDDAWYDTVRTRGEAGARLSPATDFAPAGGSIAFDAYTDWHFGTDATQLAAQQYDFYSVAAHELAHVLGVATSESWFAKVANGAFTGAKSSAMYGSAVPLDDYGGHWRDGIVFNGQETALDPIISTGTRKNYTRLDFAGLADIGWELAPAQTPKGLVATGSTTGVSLDWQDNTEASLVGYNVYFSTAPTTGFTKLNNAPLTTSALSHGAAPVGVTSYYRVTAISSSGAESSFASTSAVRMDNVAPAAPNGLSATGASTGISLAWTKNTEADLAGYNVYRSGALNGAYVKVNGPLLTSASYVDTAAPVGATSFYYVTAVDQSANESTGSTRVNASRQDTPPPPTNDAVTVQAEQGTFGGGTAVSSGNRNFTGSGYLDYGGAGSWGQVTVNRASAGNASIAIRYANGSTADRPFTVLVNGASVGTLSAPPTGSGSTWATASINAALLAGTNTIRLVAVGAGADLDQVTVTPIVADGTTTLEAESAVLGGGTLANARNVGYRGSGYADYAGAGSFVQFTVTRNAAGPASLTARYANGSTADRPFQVFVNNVNVATLSAPPTGGGSTWKTASLASVSLLAGDNVIRLVAVGAGADLDQLTIDAPITTPPPSPVDGTMTFEAEAALLGGGTLANTRNAGYLGTGYADFAGGGSYAEFTVNRSAAGAATVTARYLNGSSADRPFNVIVNGTSVGTLSGLPTGSTWRTVSLANVALRAGANTIRLGAIGYGADLDQLTIATA